MKKVKFAIDRKTRQTHARRIIKRAITILEKGWTTGWFAKTKKNKCVRFTDKKAVQFCAVGALTKSRHDLKLSFAAMDEAIIMLNKELNIGAAPDMLNTNLVKFNDNSPNKNRVIKLFKSVTKEKE